MTSTASRTSARRELLIRTAVTLGVLGILAVFLFVLPRYRWEWGSVWRGERITAFLVAAAKTLGISVVALFLSLVLGIAGGLARLSLHAVWNQAGAIYVEVVRGTPLLVQVMLAYFVFAPICGGTLEAFGAPASVVALARNKYVIGILTLAVFSGAYVTEIVRAAVQSIDRGQTEAALSQGMTRGQAYRLIIFPQAIKRMIPPLTGQFVNLIKDSSLLMVIPGLVELTQQASITRSSTYKDNEVLIPLALLYLAICFPLSRLARRLELRMAA
jgi:polar amino acid transport system permease protein